MLVALAVVVFFAFMMLALWGGYSSLEEARRAQRPAEPVELADPEAKCLLCNRPLPRAYTSDQVVNELERRIDADTAMVISYLRQPPAPEVLSRMYQA